MSVLLLTPLRNDTCQQSKKSTSVTGPQKHFKTGHVVSYGACMGDAVTAAVAAAWKGERWLSGEGL